MKVPKTIVVGCITYKIVFVGPKRMRKESGVDEAFGCVDVDKCVVYLANELKRNHSLLRDTLVHEAVGHALWTSSGIGYWMQSQTKFKRKKFFEFQEIFVRWHTPIVLQTIRGLGLLKGKS